jgi:hypothetical protein
MERFFSHAFRHEPRISHACGTVPSLLPQAALADTILDLILTKGNDFL